MIVISEDVWSPEFAELQKRHPLIQEADLWSRSDELVAKLQGAEALVVRNRTKVTRELIAAAPKLRIIARAGVGLDNIDIKAADEHGVVVSAALGINATAVAELTLGLALALARNVTECDASTRAGQWDRRPGIEITGKTWGLLGFGATGRAVAKLLAGFGCELLAYDPFVKNAEGVRLCGLEEVITNAEILSIHLPATAETTGMINLGLLQKMKSSALIVSVGRGEVITEVDLAAALRDGLIAGAALDVRATEPPKDSLFNEFANVILTPHIAGITRESQNAINQVLVSEIELALAGKPQRYAVGAIKQVAK